MGDITPVKILIVAVIALVVLGPEKLPEMMRKAGKVWSDFRNFRETMTNQVRDTVGDVPGFSELTKLTKMTNMGLKSTIASSVTAVMSPAPASTAPSLATTSSATLDSTVDGLDGKVTVDASNAGMVVRSATASEPVAAAVARPAPAGTVPAGTVLAEPPALGVAEGGPTSRGAPRAGSAAPIFAADDPSFN